MNAQQSQIASRRNVLRTYQSAPADLRVVRAFRPRHLRAGADWWIHGGSLYAKVFTQIFDSSIADNYKLRHFFMDLLVLADMNGVVDMTPTAIAGRTRIPLQDVTQYLAHLEAPDTESRTPDHDGRRIVRLDEHRSWGWCILNYDKFRAIASEDQRKALTRERVRKHREKCNASVTLGNAGNATQTETQTETQRDTVLSGKAFKAPKEKTYHKDARSVLHILNETCGHGFRETDTNLTIISQRLKEPEVTFGGVGLMIARQCQKWMNTTMADYLRPATLFGKEKFDAYYAAREQPVILADDPKAAAARQAKMDFVKAMLK